MLLLWSLVVGALTMSAVYLLLRRDVVRILMGALLSCAACVLLVLVVGGLLLPRVPGSLAAAQTIAVLALLALLALLLCLLALAVRLVQMVGGSNLDALSPTQPDPTSRSWPYS